MHINFSHLLNDLVKMESNYNSAEILSGLFKDVFGYEPLNVKRLAGAGSSRIYFRLSGRDGDSAVPQTPDLAAQVLQVHHHAGA